MLSQTFFQIGNTMPVSMLFVAEVMKVIVAVCNRMLMCSAVMCMYKSMNMHMGVMMDKCIGNHKYRSYDHDEQCNKIRNRQNFLKQNK